MRLTALALVLSSLLPALPASAAPAPDPSYTGSRHELALMTGNLPTDPYFTAIPISASYTFNFTRWLGWNVVDFSYVVNAKNKLNQNLVNTALALGNVLPVIPQTEQLLASRLAFRVRYEDFVPGVRSLEARLLIGPTMVVRRVHKEKMHYGADIAVGARVGLTPTLSLVFDVGETVYAVPRGDDNEIEDIFRIRFGLAVTP